MKYALLCSIVLFCLTGCRSAYDPYSLTPPCPTTPWTPCSSENKLIPPMYLLTSCESFTKREDSIECTLSLSQMIKLALVNSNQMRASWEQTRVAAAKYGESLSPFFPEINAEYYYEAVREGSFFGQSAIFIDQFSEWGPYASLSWLLFDSGTTWYQSEAMRQILLRANWTHNREIQTVIKKVTIDYYTYIADKELVIASEANLNDAETVLDATLAKHEYGIADLSDELQADTQVAKRELDLLNSLEQMEDAQAKLVASLGLAANTSIVIEDPAKTIDLELTLPPLDCYIAEAYTYRPDLYAAFSQVLSDASEVQAARYNRWFKLQLDATYGTTTFHTGENDQYNYSVQLNLTLPLFKGFEYLNQVRQAKAQLNTARAYMRQIEIVIIEQVTTYYQNLQIATKKVKVNLYYVEVAEEAYRATLAKYEAGTVDYVTVVNSLTELADARNSLAQSKKDWYTSLTELAYSTGTLCR